MNSIERKQARYNRRKAKRYNPQMNYDNCFTFNHLWVSAKKSYRNVSWKTSVINYKRRTFSNVSHSFFVLKDRKHKPEIPHSFTIYNRGKERKVEGITIGERVIQKCFCDYGIVPLISKSLIYDNSATLKNKGMWFCLKRTKKKYKKFMMKYSDSGYILVLDFHNYFYSIPHDILYFLIKDYMDYDSFNFYKNIVNNMIGLNLGSQLSQISAVFYSYLFDEICQKEAIYYSRYMDDSYCMFKSKDDLLKALPKILSVIESLGLEINPKKVKIIKAINGFTFLKKVFRYKNNKVIIYPKREFDRVIITKMNKLKTINNKAIKQSLLCYKPFYIKFNGYKRFKRIAILYNLKLC